MTEYERGIDFAKREYLIKEMFAKNIILKQAGHRLSEILAEQRKPKTIRVEI